MKLFPAPFFAPLFEGCLVSSPRTIHRKSTENCLLALNFCLFLPLTTSKYGNWTEQKWVKGWQTDGVGQTVRQTCRFRDLPPLSRGMPSLWWPSERIRGGCFMWQLANILMVVGCHNEVLWFFIWLGWQVFECVCVWMDVSVFEVDCYWLGGWLAESENLVLCKPTEQIKRTLVEIAFAKAFVVFIVMVGLRREKINWFFSNSFFLWSLVTSYYAVFRLLV